MVRISISVDNLSQVLAQYDQIKVWRCATETGSYTEITIPTTRIPMYPEYTDYSFDDPTGDDTLWYKVNYYSSISFEESVLSTSLKGGTEVDKLGYSFNNYGVPTGEWGKLVTADDIRYTYLFGVDCVGNDIAQTAWRDEQFDWHVELAVGEFEKYLGIDIRKRIYKCYPAFDLKRSKKWRDGVDYTDEETPYDFDPQLWENFGFMQLRHYPLISIERCKFYSSIHGEIMDMKNNNWLRISSREAGQLNMFPVAGNIGYMPTPAQIYLRFWSGVRYPGGFEVDYTTGYLTSDFVPDDLREVISKWAAVKSLAQIGDGLLAGFSSSSVSLDGLSESFSSTQSATSAYFGARIIQYQKEIDEWMKMNRRTHGAFPMSFVGG